MKANQARLASHLGFHPRTADRRADRQTALKFLMTSMKLTGKIDNNPGGHERLKPIIVLNNYIRYNIDFIFGALRERITPHRFQYLIQKMIDSATRLHQQVMVMQIVNQYMHAGALSSLNWVMVEVAARFAQQVAPQVVQQLQQ